MARKRTPKRPSGQNPRRQSSPRPPGAGGGPWTADDVQRMAINPFYAITCDPMMSTPHEPMWSREDWVRINVRLVNDLGPERYLTLLLDVLEGGYIASPDAGDEEDEE